WVDVRIGGDGYAVLGSHDRCDLVLSSDSGIWLRHMVAICVRLEDDSVGLRLIDLKTDLPFFLDDDTPQWSVTASGPFAMRLGPRLVCGFPIGPATAAEPAPPPPERRGMSMREGGRIRDPGETGILETGAASVVEPPQRPVPSPAPAELSSFVPSAPV